MSMRHLGYAKQSEKAIVYVDLKLITNSNQLSVQLKETSNHGHTELSSSYFFLQKKWWKIVISCCYVNSNPQMAR